MRRASLAAASSPTPASRSTPTTSDVTSDEWQTVASAGLTVDGIATAIEASVGWSPLGTIAWASGHSIEVVSHGEHGTVSRIRPSTASEDWRWFGAAGPGLHGRRRRIRGRAAWPGERRRPRPTLRAGPEE